MYLFGLYCNLRVEAGLKCIFDICFTIFALHLVLANNWSIVTDGCLEVIIGKRRVAIFERVLQCSQISLVTEHMVIKA